MSRIGWGKGTSATLGAPIAAFSVGYAILALAPAPPEVAFALGAHAIIPLWATLAVVLPLMRRGGHAWGVCAGLVLLSLSAARLAGA